jgi:hypothetical protein
LYSFLFLFLWLLLLPQPPIHTPHRYINHYQSNQT